MEFWPMASKVLATLGAVGALTWGTFALFDFNIVEFLLGGFPVALTVVYTLVGIGGALAIKEIYWK